MKKAIILILFIILSAISSHAASGPEIFVQTGHSSRVKLVVINQSGRYLLTVEDGNEGRFVKIWDVSTGKEIRTVKLRNEYGDHRKIQFIDDNRFIVFYEESAEIFDLYGQKTGALILPKTVFLQNPIISKDGQYLFDRDNYGVTIYSMKDGAKVLLPELSKYKITEIYSQGQGKAVDLGYGYYSIFYIGQSPKGNVDYVIYDDSLNVRMKGSLNIPDISFGSKFKVSPDLKYIAYQASGSSGDIQIYNREIGELLLSYKPRALAKKGAGHEDEYLYFGFIPDGRLRVEYDMANLTASTARMELAIINPVKNGIYTEKRLVLDDLDFYIGYQSNPYVITDKGLLIAGFANGNVKMTEINTGAEIKSFGINKLEFKAENTLTKADIISVLTSLPTWEVTGRCAHSSGGGARYVPDGWSRFIKSVDRNSIKVPFTYLHLEGQGDLTMSWKTLQVDGPTVKFDVIFNGCPRGEVVIADGKSHDCTQGFAVEVEVVSKTKVKERVVQTRATDWLGDDRIGNKWQCEWSPP